MTEAEDAFVRWLDDWGYRVWYEAKWCG